jgi:hypothetical protein
VNWLPVLLIGLGGFLVGGVLATRKTNPTVAVIIAVFAVGCVVGGILWLLS